MQNTDYGVYRIVSPSGRSYVGVTQDSFNNRWRKHKYLLSVGKHFCRALQNAYDKYGADSLSYEVLESLQERNDEVAAARELVWWEDVRSQNTEPYNQRPSGIWGNSTSGRKHSVEARRKIGEATSKRSKENAVYLPCKNCGTAVRQKPSRAKLFCSRKCYIEIGGGGNVTEIKDVETSVLRDEYILQNLTREQLAERYACSLSTVTKTLARHGLKKR